MKRKKLEPSPKYYNDLEDERANILAQLATWQVALYKVTAEAKLGEYEFEVARQQCVRWAKELKLIDKELARVKKGL